MTQSLPPKSLVLYADDDIDDLELVKDAFLDYSPSIELLTFFDGLQLLEFVQQLHPFEPLPCLVILDINMPRMDGKQALRQLRNLEAFADVPVVLFSTSTLPSEKDFARSFGAGFITKPLYTGQLYQLVDQMLEHCPETTREAIRNKRGK